MIRFYPNQGKLAKAKKESIDLVVDPGSHNLRNTYEIKYPIFEGGTIEDLLEWNDTLEK